MEAVAARAVPTRRRRRNLHRADILVGVLDVHTAKIVTRQDNASADRGVLRTLCDLAQIGRTVIAVGEHG